MSNPRTTARTVGVLFFASYVGVFVGAALMAPALDRDTSLAAINSDKARIVVGALFEFVNDAAVIGIAVLLFPFLKRAGEGLALWYVGMRILEGGMFVVASAVVLSIPELGNGIAETIDPDFTRLDDVRLLALGEYTGASTMATVAFLAGAILLYVLLYRSRLVPRFIAVWGFAAVACVIAVNLLAPDITDASGPVVLLVVPMVANEIFLAVWLIVKGFAPESTPEGVAR